MTKLVLNKKEWIINRKNLSNILVQGRSNPTLSHDNCFFKLLFSTAKLLLVFAFLIWTILRSANATRSFEFYSALILYHYPHLPVSFMSFFLIVIFDQGELYIFRFLLRWPPFLLTTVLALVHSFHLFDSISFIIFVIPKAYTSIPLVPIFVLLDPSV